MPDWFPLHCHSHFSLLDGLSKPEHIAERCTNLGYGGSALTDHGSVSGCVDFLKAMGEVCQCGHQKRVHDNGSGECNKLKCACKAFEKKPLKPILGNEFYLCKQAPTVKDSSNRRNTHLCVLAKNQAGWKSMIQATSFSSRPEHVYYRKPRLQLEQLAGFAAGNWVAFSGHLGSGLANACFANPQAAYNAKTYDEAKSMLLPREELRKSVLGEASLYRDLFGKGNFYVERQLIDAVNTPAAAVVAQVMDKAAKELGLPRLATADSHYPTQESARDQRVLLCTALETNMEEVERRLANDEDVGLAGFFRSARYHIPSFEEMAALHDPEELRNTLAVAECCEAYDILGKPVLPNFDCPDGLTPDQYLRKLCVQGWERRLRRRTENGRIVGYKSDYQSDPLGYRVDFAEGDYRDRLERELGVIVGAGLSSYFLIVQDYCHFARSNGWKVGRGRGSGAGCLVSYLIGITDVDPIVYGLYFERFYNAGRNTADRVSLPDIDVDFPKYKREKVIEYVSRKFGPERVAHLSNFTALQGRGAMKAVLRARGRVDFETMNRITKNLPEPSSISDQLQVMLEATGESSVIRWTLENDGDSLKEWCRLNAEGELEGEYQREFEQAMRLEGTYVGMSKHASGIVIAPSDLSQLVPMALDKSTNQPYVGVEMRAAEEMGLPKFDILGTSVLDKIMGAVQIIRTGDIADE